VCDDADPCTNDLCDGGVCTHPPRAAECCRSDDDCVSEAMNMCIQTRCDVDTGYCVHEPTGDCECLPIDLPQLDVSPPALELSDFSVPCPGFVGGGRLGFSEVEAELSASVNPMQCSNGCEGSASVEASLGAEIDFCQRFGLAGSFEASYERSDRGCLTCGTEEGGCEEQCEGECSTDSTSGTLEVSVEKFFGWSAGGGIGGNSISAFFTCGATVGASGSGSLTNEWVENDGYSCGDCQQCQSTDASLEASVSAGLKCQFRLNAFGQQINLGCESCAGVEVTGSVGGRLQTGECGAEGCVRGSVSGRVYAQTPCASLGWGWFSVSARCTATVAGCAEATTCGACTCGDGEPSASGVCLDGNITPEIECATGC